MKGIGSSWLSGGEHLEELRVVRVEERDVLVDPPVAPPGLLKFLEERKERRDREVKGGAGGVEVLMGRLFLLSIKRLAFWSLVVGAVLEGAATQAQVAARAFALA